jgi:hypothetical protein
VKLSVKSFWTPKEGNSTEEYEDAFAYSIEEGRFAVADGATESSFARAWANSLVQAFTNHPPPSFRSRAAWKEWLRPLGHAWQCGIDWERLPWFAVEKARAGAFSSLLGLQFMGGGYGRLRPSSKGMTARVWRWQALAIGDSCLFQVREDTLLSSFPLDRAEGFGNRPILLSSVPGNDEGVWDQVRFEAGYCRPQDAFLLMTDALARWFTVQHQDGAKPWVELCALNSQEDFESFVSGLRGSGSLRNDDVTLLAVSLEG